MAEQEQEQQQQQQQRVNYSTLTCFEKYFSFEPVNETELHYVTNYICGNLIGEYNYNYRYWYDLYSYTSKNYMVLRRKKEKGELNPVTTLGECVCQNKVINFLKNKDKKCFCEHGCASVRFKIVF